MRLIARRPAFHYAISGLLLASALLSAPLSTPLAGQAQPKYCDATIMRREVLSNERGDPLYVSPDAFLVRDSELLIAGPFSVEFARSTSDQFVPSEPNRVLAMIRRADGTSRTFPPFSTGEQVPTAVRAISLAKGSWGVLVNAATLDPNGEPLGSGTLWFATLTFAGWGAVERVPLPRGVRPHASLAQQMIVRGERVVAAMPADSGDGAFGVLLLNRERGRWQSRFINTGIASYTALAVDGATKETALAVVRADVTQARDGNSLFLMYPDRPNDSLRLLVRGGQSPIHHPTMHGTARGLSLAWRVHERRNGEVPRTAVQATLEKGQLTDVKLAIAHPARVLTLSGKESMVLVSARNEAADSIQVTVHTLPAPSEGVRLSHGSTYAEIIGAARWSESEIAVSLLAPAKSGGYLVNEILWVGTRCAPSVRGASATDAAFTYRSTDHDHPSYSSSSPAAVRERLP